MYIEKPTTLSFNKVIQSMSFRICIVEANQGCDINILNNMDIYLKLSNTAKSLRLC